MFIYSHEINISVNVTQLAILTVLSEEERSINEIGEYLGLSKKQLVRNIRRLERRGLIVRKAYLGAGDAIISITEEGMEELYKHYMVLRDLVREMEISVCTKYEC